MTPKEKAEELVSKFTNVQIEIIEQGRYSEFYPLNISEAKQCALIAVDEMILLSESMPEDICRHYIWYLNEVKKQIEKL